MPEKQIQPIQSNRFGLAPHKFLQFSLEAPASTEIDDITNPKLYEHVAKQLSVGDEIRILHDEMEWRAEVMVTYVNGPVVHVALLGEPIMLDQAVIDSTEGEEFGIKLRGQRRWCIVHMATGEVVKEQIPNKAAAMKELQEYRNALAA